MRSWTGSRFFLPPLLVAGALLGGGCSRSGQQYQVVFADAPQLKAGAKVCYLGVPVGEVESISLRGAESEAASQVVARIALRPGDYQVRQRDRFRVLSEGLLGDNYIDIVPTESQSSPLPLGATVQGEPPRSVSSLRGLSGFSDLMGLAAKLNSLPEAKRQEVLKTLHHVVDEAVGAAPASQSNAPPGKAGKD